MILVDGVPALYVERGGRTLQTLPAFDDAAVAAAALAALRGLIGEGRDRELVVGADRRRCRSRESPHRAALLGAGFVAGYRGLVLRGR